MITHRIAPWAAVLAVVLLASSLQAATTNWTGGTSAVWNDPLNWDNGVPTAGNDAVFPATIPGTGATITVAAGMVANSITFNGSYTLTGGSLTLTASNCLNAAAGAIGTISTPFTTSVAAAAVGINGINTVNVAVTTGTIVLGAANTYTGATNILAGIASVANASGLGTGTVAVTVSNGGELEVNAALTITGKNLSINGTGVSGSAFTIKANTTWGSGAVGTCTAATPASIGVGSGATLTFANAPLLIATAAITKVGAGNLTFAGAGSTSGTGGFIINAGFITNTGNANFNSGNIVVNNGGTLQISGGGTDAIANAATITVNNGGILDWQQTGAESFAGLTLNGTGSGAGAMINGGNTVGGAITAPVTIGSNTTINSGTNQLSLASAISGATFTLTKTGTGSLIVSGNNTCAALNVFAGTYSGRAVVGSNPYGTGTITLGDSTSTSTAANLQISSNITQTYANPIVTGTNMAAGTLQISDPSGANITFSGPITLNNSNVAINNSNGQASSFLNFTGGVTGSGNLTFNGSGNGSPITFSGGAVNMTGTITNASANAAGVVTINSVLGPNVTAVTQSSGSAPLVLGGTNTYAGAVTVTANSLYVAASGTVPGAVNVTSANLSGGGTINGAVTLAGTNPTLTPGDLINNGNGNNGNGIGTLTVGNNVTFSTPGTLTFQLGATGDKLATTGTGNVIFGASGTVNLVAANGFNPANVYTIVDTSAGTGTISGAATLTITLPGYTVTTNKNTATNTLTVGPFTPSGAATQLTWVGGSGSDLATAANWSPAKSPTDSSGPFELVFAGAAPGTITNNTMQAGTGVLALTFTASGYTLTGNQLTLLASASSATSPVGTGIGVANGVTALVNTPLALGSVSADIKVGAGGALTLGGVISSTGLPGVVLSKSGTGALTLSAANTLLGGVTLNAGLLNINNNGALGLTGAGVTPGTFTYNGGAIDNTSGAAVSVGQPVVLGADVVYTGTGNLTFSGTVALGGNRIFTTNSTNNSILAFTNVISGTGTVSKQGPSQLTLSGANTFTGNVTLSGGILSVGNSAALGVTANTFTINGGTTLDASAGTTLNAYPTTLAGDITFVGTNALSLGTGAMTIAAPRVITVNASTLTFAGSIGASTAGLTKNGPGTLTLSGSSGSFSGTFTINAGTLSTTNGTTIAATSNIVWGSGSTGTWNVGASQSVASINSDATNPGSPILTGGNFTLTINGASASVFAGTIQQTAANLSINKTTAGGSLTLSGNNTYAGTTTISAGTLNINGTNAIGTGTLVVASGATFNNTSGRDIVMATNNAITLNTSTFTGTNAITFGTGAVALAQNTTLTISANTLAFGGNVGGAFSLAKAGNGTLSLNGATNTYSISPTNVTAGSLIVNGSIPATVTVAVSAGATLGGTGSILGPLTVANTGVVNPGLVNQSGTLTTAAITNTATPVFNFQLNAAPSLVALAGNDFINSGTATVALGTTTFNISGGGNFTNGGVYKLINTTGTVSGTASLGTMPAGWTGVLAATSGTGVTLTVTQAATTFVWNGSVSGDMNVAGNWTPNTVPVSGTGANLIFPTTAGTKALIFNNASSNFTANSMTFSDATGYTITAGTTTAIALPASSATLTPLSCTAGTNVLNIDMSLGSGVTGRNVAVLSGVSLSLNGTTGTTLLTPTTQLTLDNAGTLNIGAIIGGGAANVSILNSTGGTAGVTTFSGANTYSGTTAVAAGTLKLGSTSALGTSSATTVTAGAALDLAGQVLTSALPVTVSGTGISGAGAILNSSTNPATNTGAITLTGNTLISNPTGSGILTLGAINGSASFDLTFNAVSANGLTIGGGIGSNVANITKLGVGQLSLNGANAYTGGTSVTAGILQVGNASALGATGSGTVIASGAVLDLNGTTLNAESFTIAGTGGTSLGVIINSSATGGAAPGPITMTAASTIFNGSAGGIALGAISNSSFLLTVDGSGATAINGVLGSGSGGLTKNGLGSLTLAAANTYTGATTINKGTLALGADNALPQFSAVTVNADTTAAVSTILNFAGFGSKIASLTALNDNAGNVDIQNVGNLTVTGSLILGRHVTANTNINTCSMTMALGKSLSVGSNSGSALTLGDYITTAAASGQVTTVLDASNASGVSVNVGSLILGNSGFNGGNLLVPATLTLPTSGASAVSITASTAVQIGKTANNGLAFACALAFGGGSNVVTTPLFTVGGNKLTSATVTIASGGTLTLSGTMALQIADQSAFAATGTMNTSTFNMTGGTLNAGGLGAVTVGKYAGGGTGGAVGTLDLGTSPATLVAMTSLNLGQETTGAQTGNSTTGALIVGGGKVTIGSLGMGASNGASSVPINGTLTINGGAVLVTGSITLATGSGAVTNPTTGTINLNAGTLTVAGNIAKGGGTGLLSAIFNFNGGILRAGANNATFMTGLNAANINNSVTIDTNGFNIAIGQALLGSGTGAITKIGAGTLALNGINTYTGLTTVSNGSLGGSGTIAGSVFFDTNTALSPGSAGIGTLTMNSSVTFNSSNFAYDLGIPNAIGSTFNDLALASSGTPSLDFGGVAGTLTINRTTGFNVGTYTLLSGYSFLNAANLPVVAPISGVTMNTSIVGNKLLLNVTAINYTPSGALATWTGTAGDHNWSNPLNWGGTDITVGGPYELIFPAAPVTDFVSNNDIVAPLTIRSILINSTTSYTIGTSGGGTVTINGSGTYSGTPISILAGTHTISSIPLAWTADSVILVNAGGLTLSSNIANSTFQTYFNTSVDVSYSGVLGGGSGGVVKAGAGRVLLSGTNTYTGINTINEGTVSIAAPANLGLSSLSNSVVFASGGSGILQLSGTQTSGSKGILLSGNGIIDIPNGADAWTLNAAANVISGAGGLTKVGAGTLIMSQANTFVGPVTINAGTFQLGNATGLGPAASAQVNFGAGSTGVLAMNGINATVVGLNSDAVTPGTPVIRNGHATTASTLTLNNTTIPSTFAGVIQNGGAATQAITKNGAAGTLVLSGNNTNSGNPTLTAGTLKLGSSTALGAATVTLTTTAGTLDLNGNNLTVANFAGNANCTVTDTASVAGTTTLTVTALTATIANPILDGVNGRVIAVAVANSNAGIANLSNVNSTFSGGFTLLNSASGTRLDLVAATSGNLGAGTAGAIISGPFGRGPIIIGQLATDKAGIFIPNANTSIFNDVVFNTTLGTDRLGIRVDGTGCVLAGKVMCNNSSALISTNGTGVLTITGQITSTGAGPTGLILGDTAFGTSLNVILANTANPANDYTGDTVIQNRATTTLTLGADNQIPDGAGKGNLSVVGATNSNFKLAGFSETINGLSGAGIVDGVSGTSTLTVGNNDQTSTFSGVLQNTAGALAITKIGTGTLTLSGNSTFSGTTAISNGTVQIGSGGTTGSFGTGPVVNNSALVFNRSNALTISNNVSGSGSLTLNGGAGTVYTISGNNSYDGLTTSNVPQIVATSATAFGSTVQGTVINIGTVSAGFGSRLDLSNVNIVGEPLTLPSNTTGDLRSSLVGTSGTSTWGGPITLTGTGLVQVRGEPGILNITGDIGDAGFTGTLLLRGTSATTCSITGAIAIPSGKFSKTDANAWTVGAAAKVYNWTTTQVSVGTLAMSASNVLPSTTVVTMGQNDTNNVTLDLGGFNQIVGGLVLSTTGGTKSITSATAASLTVDTSITQTYNGPFSGALQLVKAGIGTLNIGGVNTQTGGSSITAGTLRITNVASLGNGGLALSGGLLDLNTFSPTVTSLSGTGGTISDAGAGVTTSTLTVNQAIDTAFGGTIQNGATRVLALTKSGVGALTLSAANTFTGNSAINGGSLLASNTTGSALGSGTVTVAAGATLGGTGSISGVLTVNGNVSPGIGGVGTFSATNNVTFNSGSSLTVDLVGATGDQLVVGGTMTLGANVALNATASSPTHGNVFTIVSKSGATVSGTFNSLVENTPFMISGRPFLIQYAGGDGNDILLYDDDVPAFTAAATNTTQALDEAESVASLLANDPDGDALTFTLISGFLPAGVVLNTDGSFGGVTSFSAAGNYTVVIQATDPSGGYVRTTLNISVSAVRLSINDLSVAEFAGTANLTVTRTGLGHQTVTVQATTANGTALAGNDYTAISVLVTIPAGQFTQTVAIPILDDAITEPSEIFTTTLSAPTNSQIGAAGTGTVTIIDDETTPTLSVSSVSVGEGAGSVVVTVDFVGASSQSISVDYSTSNIVALAGLDYVATSGTLVWQPAELGSKSFTVQILEDSLDENDEPFSVNLANAVGAASIIQASANVVIRDNDLPPVAVVDSAVTAKGVAKTINVLANDINLVNTPITVSVFFGAAHGTVTINADSTATYTPDSAYAGIDSFIYRITDSAGQTSNATVTINVIAPPAFTSAPTLTPNPALAGQLISGTAGFQGGSITWDWGDGSPIETSATVSHTFLVPGIYNVVTTLTSPQGVQTVNQTQIFIGMADGSGTGGGGGATPPGVNGILVGTGGAGKLQGGSGKLSVSYTHRDKTTFSGSLGRLTLAPTLTQNDLTGLAGKVTVGTGVGAPAAQFPFTLGKTGKAKAAGLSSFELSVKKKRVRFIVRREDLTAIMESLGAATQSPVDKKKVIPLLIPVTVQVGDKIYLAMTFSIKYKQSSPSSGKGGI